MTAPGPAPDAQRRHHTRVDAARDRDDRAAAAEPAHRLGGALSEALDIRGGVRAIM